MKNITLIETKTISANYTEAIMGIAIAMNIPDIGEIVAVVKNIDKASAVYDLLAPEASTPINLKKLKSVAVINRNDAKFLENPADIDRDAKKDLTMNNRKDDFLEKLAQLCDEYDVGSDIQLMTTESILK